VWFGNLHADATPPVLADSFGPGGLNFVMGSELNEYVQFTLIPSLMGLGVTHTHDGQAGNYQTLYNYYMQTIGEYANQNPNMVFSILVAKDGHQETERDPGGLLRRQLAIDAVDCNGVFYCGDYIVEDLFFVDEPPYADDEYAEPDSEYIWPWPQYCQPLKADGYAAGELSCWILGIPPGFNLVFPKLKVRLKDDVNNWRRFTIYDYDSADFWIYPPEQEEQFYFGDLVDFRPNFNPQSLDGTIAYTNWLPVDGNGNERFPFSQDPINGYKSLIHTPPVGPNFLITLQDENFWLKAYQRYCVNQPESGEKVTIMHINGIDPTPPPPPPAPQISFDPNSFNIGTYNSGSGPYSAHRQYVNLDKIQTEDLPPPENRDDWLRVKVVISDLPANSWVRFYYCDIPIQDQSSNDQPFPWDPNLPPSPGDNLGQGAGFTEVGGSNPLLLFDLPAQETIEVDFHTSHFGGDNYMLYVALYDRCPSEQGAGILDSDGSPTIEVWRYYYIVVYSMADFEHDNPGPEYYPYHDMVQEIFDSNTAFVDFHFSDEGLISRDIGLSEDVPPIPWNAHVLGTDLWLDARGTAMDYTDDITGVDLFTSWINFHSPPYHYDSPPHSIHLQGVDVMEDISIPGNILGIAGNFDGATLSNLHVHDVIAITTCKNAEPSNPEYFINVIVCHEFGHTLVGLLDSANQQSIMYYLGSLPLGLPLFTGQEILKLRDGPYFDEFLEVPSC